MEIKKYETGFVKLWCDLFSLLLSVFPLYPYTTRPNIKVEYWTMISPTENGKRPKMHKIFHLFMSRQEY